MASENRSPAKEPTTARGRGRGGRGGRRGRGGGRGASNSASVTKSTAPARGGRGGSRRGRAKNFADSRVQAAYERQRDLKATYQAVAHAIKPALQELAERAIEDLLTQPATYKEAAEYRPIVEQLSRNYEARVSKHGSRLQQDLRLAENTYAAEQYVANQSFKNGVEDVLEQLSEAQANRLRILHALHQKGLPVDVRDDQFEYKVISDDHLDKDFGIYECYKKGHLVPYPSRVRGTEMWRMARESEAAIAASAAASAAVTATSTPVSRGRGRGRGLGRRRAQEAWDSQPTPKRSTRGLDESQLYAPAAAKGLLASAAEAEARPDSTPDEESVPASPEPLNLANGSFTSTLSRTRETLSARERSPPPPKNAAEPDAHGVRTYNQKPSLREKGINSRLLAPHLFRFNDWEIGFRDSSNDSSKGHTRAKRGKYLDSPNSNGMHFDHWCNGYDYSNTPAKDFDQGLIERHGVHPNYGVFLPNSRNDKEVSEPYVMPGKPVVFIANPSGRVSHASRSFQSTLNHRNADDAPWRSKVGSSLLRFCKMDAIDHQDISIQDYLPTEDELRERSLGTAQAAVSSGTENQDASESEDVDMAEAPADQDEDPKQQQLSLLTYAAAFVEASDVTRAAPAAAKPARYDAIRDVFTDAKPSTPPAPKSDGVALNFLAELCHISSRPSGSEGAPNLQQPLEQLPASVAPQEYPIPESNVGGTMYSDEQPQTSQFGYPMGDDSARQLESAQTFVQHQPLSHFPVQLPQGPVHTDDPMSYQHGHEQQHIAQQPLVQGPPPTVATPGAEYSGYPRGGSYAFSDTREPQMGFNPMDTGYSTRRTSGYGPEPAASYPPSIWAQHAPSGPPVSMTPGPPPQSYSSRAPPPSLQPGRVPFSQSGSAEPLPPLRPPRAASSQSMPEEPAQESNVRQEPRRSTGGFLPLGPAASYHSRHSTVEPHPPLQPISTERFQPSPQQPSQSFTTSPQQGLQPGFMPQILSPTYGTPVMAGPPTQSPPGTPQGQPNSAHRHRSTPSGSSDTNSNKYRKLQPAPIPAHRSGWGKQELKTIPYDVKEMGSSAALPSSGPTQIRGWNVNQHRKRGKADKQDRDRAESATERDDLR